MKGFVPISAVIVFVAFGATGQPAPLKRPNAVEITAQQLEEGLYSHDLFDVLSALMQETGIAVKSSSDVGAEDWLLIRGYPRDSTRNILVLIDGMPLNDALSGANEFEHLPPLDIIERIVIYKPPLPARFGGAMGAIEVFTRGNFGAARGSVSAAYGDYGSGFGSALVEGTKGPFSIAGTVDYLDTDNLTGQPRTPPVENSSYGDRSFRIVKPALKLNYQLSQDSRLTLLTQLIDSQKFFSDQSFRGEQEHRNRTLLNFNAAYHWNPGSSFQLTANGYRSDEDYRLNLRMHPNVRDQHRVVQGFRINASVPLPGQQVLSLGGDFTDLSVKERLEQPLLADSARIFGLYLEDEILISDSFWASLGLRRDDHSEAAGVWNPSLALGWKPGKRIHLFGLWGRSSRWPGLSEFDLQDEQLGLEGELLTGVELGTELQLVSEKLSLQASFFDLSLKDESVFFMERAQGPPRFYYGNSKEDVSSRGVETAVRVRLSERFVGTISYTHNTVENSNSPVSFAAPEQLFSTNWSYRGSRLALFGSLRCAGSAKGIQRMGGAPTTLEGWCVVDLASSFRLNSRLDLVARVANLTDTQFETFQGRPMFGRVAVTGLRLWLFDD